MVAAFLQDGLGKMVLFNHTVEYSVELSRDEVSGDTFHLRKAAIEYDDFWGNRQRHTLVAPADLWTTVKIGGTASAGCLPSQGMVTAIQQGIRRTVWTSESKEVTCHCLPIDDDIQVGDQGFVVDHMRHDPGSYGVFEKCIMRNIPVGANPNLHSINLIIFKDNEQVGIIHLDPYVVTTPNYDDLDSEVVGMFSLV